MLGTIAIAKATNARQLNPCQNQWASLLEAEYKAVRDSCFRRMIQKSQTNIPANAPRKSA